MKGKKTALMFNAMLIAIDAVERELDELQQEDAGDAAMQAAYEKVGRTLVRARCDLQDVVDEEVVK
jgi:hypothetical protein